MITEDFIAATNKVIATNVIQDKNGNIVRSFKVLYGIVKVEGDFVQLTSVYPISDGMSILFGVDRIFCYCDPTDRIKVKETPFGDFYEIDGNYLVDRSYPVPYTQNVGNGKAIYIAVNTNPFQEAENHNLIKTLGHPTNYQAVKTYPPYVGGEGERHIQTGGSYFF
jgi:hypothetical protein